MTKRGSYLKKKDVYRFWCSLPLCIRATEAVKAAEAHFKVQGKRSHNRLWRMWEDFIISGKWFSEPAVAEPASAVDSAHVPVVGGTMAAPDARRQAGTAKTYVFTTAQNNTELIPQAWWDTLLTLVSYYDAELHVSQFTYNKSAYGSKAVKPGSAKGSDHEALWYDARLLPYVSDEDIQITPDLVWLGSLNMSPTLVNPISGFQNHTRQASAIIPHTRIAMESVATMKDDPARFVFTTGAVTQRNYIQKSAGQKADFHHTFGALLVEVGDDGKWWARQLNFDKDGGLYDLNRFFGPDTVYEEVRVQAVTHGDIHGYKRDAVVCDSVFGAAGMMDTLMPREQFFHDIIDFMPRNHHNRKDFQFLREMWNDEIDSVEGEFRDIGYWLTHDAYRQWCSTFVVVSNHDQAINNWLADPAGLYDPPNLQLWLSENLNKARFTGYHPFASMLRRACEMPCGDAPRKPRVLLEDESYKILGQIEAGLHGHLGPNGSRGAPRNLKTVGKANTGHTHSAGIHEGVYTAGVLGRLDMGYNKGPSSWSHSSVVTYPNAKRAVLTHNGVGWWRS